MIGKSDAKMSELASEQTRLKKAQQSLMVCVCVCVWACPCVIYVLGAIYVVGVSMYRVCSGRVYVSCM